MKKKFSTLMASLLLASAFSTASALSFPEDLKEGDFVHLTLNSERLQIVKDSNNKSVLEQTAVVPAWTGTETEKGAAEYINAVNAQLWKVAKITKTDTGDKTYQFVNKLTGEYLAIDLETNDVGYVTNGAAKLSPSGNREWAFDGSKRMYAYSTSKDSTFTFDANMKLISNPEKDAATGATAFVLDQTVSELKMTANAFNALMGLTGNNGKLNFNGGKDVTSTQTNILKNVNWEAEDRAADGDNTLLYLWNGNTTKGYDKALNTTKIDRKLYLQVDTAYYDEKTPNYFKLDVDTLNYELGESGGIKPVLKHPEELAQFRATYDFITDSIGIKAVNVPAKAYSVDYEWDGTDEVTAILNQVRAYAYYSNATAIKQNVDALIAGYKTWKTETYKTRGVGVKFGAAGEGKALLDAVTETEFNAWKASLAATEVGTGYAPAVVATFEGVDGAAAVVAEIEAFLANTAADGNTVKLTTVLNGFKAWYVENSTAAVNEMFNASSAVSSVYNDVRTAYNTGHPAWFTMFDGAKCTRAYVAATDAVLKVGTEVDDDDVNAAKNLTPYIYKDKVDALFADYNSKIGVSATKNATVTVGSVIGNDVSAFGALETSLVNAMNTVKAEAVPDEQDKWFWDKSSNQFSAFDKGNWPVSLRSLANITVLTVNADDEDGYVLPLIQPYATSSVGTTDIIAGAKVYNLVKKDAEILRATNVDKYLVDVKGGTPYYADNVDASNVYAQWVFIPGTSGFYTVQNRATEQVLYTGPVMNVKDADGKAIADAYVFGTDTLKLAAVTLNEDNFYTEKVGNKNVQYDYSGTFYQGDKKGVDREFTISPVSPFLSSLTAQFDKDSVMVLDAAENTQVWIFDPQTPTAYGVKIDGLPQLKKQTYKIYKLSDKGEKEYIEEDVTNGVYILKNENTAGLHSVADFEIRSVAEGQYNLISLSGKMTINATPSKPILELSTVPSEKNDLFLINKAELNKYRKLTAEDGVLSTAKIYMENEPNRYLYENTANIVANNGNKIAKDSLNFLGIYNTAAMDKNAALFVDTAYVEREGVYMPQYMFALNVTNVPAHEAIDCTYEHNHFDNAGNKVDAAHCSHATPATLGYKSGRYLVALTDSIEGVSKHPGRYDGETRLAFVEAIHRNAEDSLIIKNSKWTDNNKQIVAGQEATYASKDTIKIEDNKTKAMTFALEIADQSTQSFYLATSGSKYVRILNGVPVLTGKKDDAAIFNIEATTEEATANEAIEAAGVQVIGGQGVVTVQGAAGKVITVANILGQTIANQVAASDNVTIAAPAGVVVVAVDGDATKVVVK